MSVAILRETNVLPIPAEHWVYTLARLDNSIAVISSDDSLVLLDPSSLQTQNVVRSANKAITSLVSGPGGKTCATAGRDGLVKVWDARGGDTGMTISLDSRQSISALAMSGDFIAGGTESAKEGPGDVGVYLWDVRSPKQLLRSYTESHNDTIGTLTFHPSRPTHLFSSSTDALLTLFDTSQSEEDDAVLQVFNHRAAVHCATFLSEDEIVAVSSDEQLTIYGISKPEDVEREEVSAVQTVYGDMREPLGCGYVIDFVHGAEETWIATGDLEKQSLVLTPLHRAPGGEQTKYSFDQARSISFAGAHGGEIARHVLLEPSAGTVLSCGEDGAVKAWDVGAGSTRATGAAAAAAAADEGHADDMHVDLEERDDGEAERRRRKKEKRRKKRDLEGKEKKRYAPY